VFISGNLMLKNVLCERYKNTNRIKNWNVRKFLNVTLFYKNHILRFEKEMFSEFCATWFYGVKTLDILFLEYTESHPL
jgi:hypothetical protein